MHYRIQQGTRTIPPSPELLSQPLLTENGAPHPNLTVGHYFAAVQAFLASLFGAGRAAGMTVISVKLGAFYHVARIEEPATGQCWALNTAFSPKGCQCLAADARLLAQLHQRRPSLAPRPEAGCDAETNNGLAHPAFAHLLVEWLDDFHEWHATHNGVVLWDTVRGDRLLGAREVGRLFFGMGRLLSLAFDPATGNCLTDWHHGAGDFVARTAPLGLAVKLVTVRAFAPPPFLASDTMLPIRLVYLLLDGSIRLRLDKRDGVGETVWHGPLAATAALTGLWRGLADLEQMGELPAGTVPELRQLLCSFTTDELAAACAPLLAWYETILDPDDNRCVHQVLPAHLSLFRSAAGGDAPA